MTTTTKSDKKRAAKVPKAAKPKGKAAPATKDAAAVIPDAAKDAVPVVVVHVFPHGDAWLVMRSDSTVLATRSSKSEAGDWVRENAAGCEVVEEAPPGFEVREGKATAGPAAGSPASVELRELADNVAAAEATKFGLELRFIGKAVKSKPSAIAAALGAASPCTKPGDAGSILVVGHGAKGDLVSAAVLEWPKTDPKPEAKAKAKAPAKAGGERAQAFGLSMTALLRYLGSLGATKEAAMRVCEAVGLSPNPATVNIQVKAGTTGARGGVPTVTEDQAAEIAKALATVK